MLLDLQGVTSGGGRGGGHSGTSRAWVAHWPTPTHCPEGRGPWKQATVSRSARQVCRSSECFLPAPWPAFDRCTWALTEARSAAPHADQPPPERRGHLHDREPALPHQRLGQLLDSVRLVARRGERGFDNKAMLRHGQKANQNPGRGLQNGLRRRYCDRRSSRGKANATIQSPGDPMPPRPPAMSTTY